MAAKPSSMPRHVAIIMDGNGRWATERGGVRVDGHQEGAQVVRKITTHARTLGIPYLTLYSFSVQNWRRDALEIAALMALLERYCKEEIATLKKNRIRLQTLGRLDRLPESTRLALTELVQATARDDWEMTLTLAIDYGGREEILAAASNLVAQVGRGDRDMAAVSEAEFSALLSSHPTPDPDLMIRTSGELRLSNFLLWQLAYAELYFSSLPWPQFGPADFDEALRVFSDRERRFGGVPVPSAQKAQGC